MRKRNERTTICGCTLMMFGSIVVSGVQMIANYGYNSRNVTIASLALSIGIGFTKIPAIFKIFPDLIKNVFCRKLCSRSFYRSYGVKYHSA